MKNGELVIREHLPWIPGEVREWKSVAKQD